MRKLDHMRKVIAENRAKNGEKPAAKVPNNMPIGKKPAALTIGGVPVKDIARELLDYFFTNGMGQKADRLVLEAKGGPKLSGAADLGGYSRDAAETYLLPFLARFAARPGVATLPPPQPPKRVCRRCGKGFDSDLAVAAHDCPNPKPDRSAEGRDAAMKKKGRLPHLSQFHVEYNAAAGQWYGTLTIFGEGFEVVKTFLHAADGVFRLIQELDDRYRDWLPAQPKPQE